MDRTGHELLQTRAPEALRDPRHSAERQCIDVCCGNPTNFNHGAALAPGVNEEVVTSFDIPSLVSSHRVVYEHLM